MPGLLRDRYFEYAPERAWDLVTGEAVSTTEADWMKAPGPAPPPLIELLEHGVEGHPRRFVLDTIRMPWRIAVRIVAAEAQRRGYVPIAVEVFRRTRLLLADDLRTRAIALIAKPTDSSAVLRAALLQAAAISSGPHLLVTSTANPERRVERWQAAEARASYANRMRIVPRTPFAEEVRHILERSQRATELIRRGRHASAERLHRESAAALVRRRAAGPAAETYIALGRLLLERGSVAAADAAFGEAAVQAEGVDAGLTVAARLWQAAARTDAGRLTAAEALCRAVLTMDPVGKTMTDLAEATLGRVLLWQGRSAEAAALPFIQRAPSEPYVAAMRVRILLQSGDYFEAGRGARELLNGTANADHDDRLIALCAHFRVLAALGDVTLAADAFQTIESVARAARTPLRLARMRLLWSRALKRAGDSRGAARELRALTRMRSAMPPLLRSDIDRGLNPPVPATKERARTGPGPGDDTIGVVAIAQGEADDDDALQKVGEFVVRSLQGTRLELWTADAGPATAIVSCGGGLPTRLGPRTLEAGIVVGPEAVESGWELAVPVRLGTRLVGALVARWPADRACPENATALMNLASAVIAPRVESRMSSAREAVQVATAIPELVGGSAAMAEVRRAIARAAGAPFSVLIEGESGVGKELVARAIHQLSPRRDRRFCDVNCAALPDDLFEAELFGHARGAFTGAVTDRAGLVEEADGGTLFLDEVADLSSRAQAKLLRVVQQQEVRRVGETFTRKVDVRFVSAANRDLRTECEHGRFRQDLLYRFDVIRIRIPPLRERPEDIPALTQHFWALARSRVNTACSLSHGVVAALARYHWPGNVRELQNVLSALAVAAPARGQVRATLLPAVITGVTAVTSGRLSTARYQWERRFVEIALARAGGSRSRAARELGLSRQGLLKVLERLRLS